MLIKVNFPGYWAHGKTFEAEVEHLIVSIGNTSEQDAQRRLQWDSKPTGQPGEESVACYVIASKDGTKWAIPMTRATEVVVEAA